MALYDRDKEKEDRVFIPKWEYRALRDTATRVDVLAAEIEAEEAYDQKQGYKAESSLYTNKIKRILGLDRKKAYTTDIVTQDDLADAFGYTE